MNRKRLFFASWVVFCVSLLLPTHCTNMSCSGFGGGAQALFLGWFMALFKGAAFAWLANPVYFFALYWNKKEPLISLIFVLFALWLGTDFLKGGEFIMTEAGHSAYVTKILIGYWVWMLGMSLLAAAAIAELVERRRKKKDQNF